MHRTTIAALAGALLAAPAVLGAQDVVAAAPAHNRIVVENAHVRVVASTLGPGEREARHVHPAGWYYVTRGGRMRVTFADGREVVWEPKTGEAFWGDAEGPHTSENVGDAPMSFVLVEVRSAAEPVRAASVRAASVRAASAAAARP